MFIRTGDHEEELKVANFELELQFIFVPVPCYFCISTRCRVCRRHQREIVSGLKKSLVELPILSIEHSVGVQEAEIAFVGFLCSPQAHLPI